MPAWRVVTLMGIYAREPGDDTPVSTAGPSFLGRCGCCAVSGWVAGRCRLASSAR